MERPMVGIMPLVDVERESYWMLPSYMEGLASAGAIPVMLPLTSNRKALEQMIEKFDGFLLTGGQDVSPSVYGEAALPVCGDCCTQRDEMERDLLALAWERDKPVLGICRGIQFMNVVFGGTLYQDLPSQRTSGVEHHQSPPYDEPVHEVDIVEDSPLHRLLGQTVIPVNSYHHQAVKKLAPKLCAMAYSEDGLVEAVYAPEKKYVWAFQWHPEFSYLKDDNSKKIFQSFVASMR